MKPGPSGADGSSLSAAFESGVGSLTEGEVSGLVAWGNRVSSKFCAWPVGGM